MPNRKKRAVPAQSSARPAQPVGISQSPPVPAGAGHLAKLKPLGRRQDLPIRSLNACQVRRGPADPATVARYRELLAESEPPPIIVILDSQGRHYIADGHNRTAAALAAGRSVVLADIYSGTPADARLVGLECNQHGLGLTLAEKKAALDELLDARGQEFSDSVLSRLIGLDRHTVEKRRREREGGDFIAAASRLRHPGEALNKTAAAFARQAERLGAEVFLKAWLLLPQHLRDETLRLVTAQTDGEA